MDLYDITINGKKYPVATSYAEVQSDSRTGRTAKVVGGTAAVGAIIGAIAGGGKGAAIGAASGAGAGTAVQVLTKGQRVKIPSESRLEFTLKQPLVVE
jgi:outer membrane lipoprotein SlyB